MAGLSKGPGCDDDEDDESVEVYNASEQGDRHSNAAAPQFS